MGVTRRLGSANALYGVLSLLFPPLAYIPGGALAAVFVVVGAIWGTNHFWVGPAALSTQRQRGLAKERLKQLRAERVAHVVSAGRLLEPPEAWLDGVLADREEWARWSERLRHVRVHDPRNRLSDFASLKLMLFLAKHKDDWLARGLAFGVFRVGGAHRLLYREVVNVRDSAEAMLLFDALETRELLADREYWDKHVARRVKPWPESVFDYLGGYGDDDMAFGVFAGTKPKQYFVRAAGERAPEAWRECRVRFDDDPHGRRAYLSWNNAGHPDFGVSFFRMNELRPGSLLSFEESSGPAEVHLACGDRRLPPEGGIALR